MTPPPTHTHTVGTTPLVEGSVHRRPVTQHSLGTNIHAPGGIRTRNPSKLANADPRLRRLDRRDRRKRLQNINCSRLRSSQCSHAVTVGQYQNGFSSYDMTFFPACTKIGHLVTVIFIFFIAASWWCNERRTLFLRKTTEI